ncbi:hypothetical protein KIN20_006105 [Parelaphostrongylus tenuis]|uniref:Uncharacterized protein n=1 Tax=Parelaphostrongylus tenuis TaxID=148309 RepID=A0AAD5QKR6_PARTN|nr:hypothetical protein KIN20_006105 [Parelaphostrongylus tenuis]
MSADADPSPVRLPATDPGKTEVAIAGATSEIGDGIGPSRAVQHANGDIPEASSANVVGKQSLIKRVSCLACSVHLRLVFTIIEYGVGLLRCTKTAQFPLRFAEF